MYISSELKAFIEEAAKDDLYWVEHAKVDFAVALEAQRRRSGLSYKALAERMKSSAAYISKVFRGDSNLTIESMVKLARAAGGKLEIRVIRQEDFCFAWNQEQTRQPSLRLQDRPLVAEVADTIAEVEVEAGAGAGAEAEADSKVHWTAEHFFKRAA